MDIMLRHDLIHIVQDVQAEVFASHEIWNKNAEVALLGEDISENPIVIEFSAKDVRDDSNCAFRQACERGCNVRQTIDGLGDTSWCTDVEGTRDVSGTGHFTSEY